MVIRVPKVFQFDGTTALGQEGISALEAGYPVRITQKLPCLLSESLRNRVSTWPSKGFGTKNPSWVIQENQLKPARLAQRSDAEEFLAFLRQFLKVASSTVGTILGLDCHHLCSDRVTWRPYELATTARRWNARDDLFHLDSFPSRPAEGRRILRLFYNASRSDSVVWSHTFNLDNYVANYLYDRSVSASSTRPDTFGDSLMAQIHDQMKRHEDFQETAPRVLHTFAPGEAWVALTDTCLHSYLRGEWLMDVSWFVSAPWLTESYWAPKASFDRLVNGKSQAESGLKQAA